MALKGIRVIELEGLAPGPFCGMILKDFGASVTVIAKIPRNPFAELHDGKTVLPIDLKNTEAQEIVRKLCTVADVLIDPFRPGVLERLGLGPDTLLARNPRLIYARLTGFGQTGPLSLRAGHDINYVAMSGVLSLLGRHTEKPLPPINLLADFAGGGLLCAFGICAALLERHASGKGQVIDASMTEGVAYIASWITRSQHRPIWGNERGRNILDGGAFYYDTYKTKDGKYMSVGAIEPVFFDNFIQGLGLSNISQFGDGNDRKAKIVSEIFKQKTQQEWTEIFEPIDACVFPVLDLRQVSKHSHNIYRNSFVEQSNPEVIAAAPAPVLCRKPAKGDREKCQDGDESVATKLLLEIGVSESGIKRLQRNGVIDFVRTSKL